jgi:hypothetical protein
MTPASASPYARVGAKLVDNGFSAVPCAPGVKVPGAYKRNEWRLAYDWTRFAERLPTDLELRIWSTWPDAGVCIVLGGAPDAVDHVVCVDVDSTDERMVEAIRDVLPESPIERTGQKGYAALFRASPSLASATLDVDGSRAVDFLANGRQVVVPPSIHPSTNRPYTYTGMRTLEDVTPAHLPRLPDDFVERMRGALAPFGEVRHNVDRRRDDDCDDDSTFAETNRAALDNFDAWLPSLGVLAKRERDGGYRGPAVWRGGNNPTSVSYDHRGIRDFKADVGHSPIGLVMLVRGDGLVASDNWLRRLLGLPVIEPVKFTFRKDEFLFDDDSRLREFAGVIRIPYSEGRWVLRSEAEEEASDRRTSARAPDGEAMAEGGGSPLDAIELGKGVDWTRPDGKLGWIVDWTMSQMRRPNRPLAVASAIATMAPVAGWRNIYSPSACALNVYIAALAPTAVGKDAMLKAPGRILKTVGVPNRLYSSSDAFSLSAQEKILHDHPAIVLALDEVATNMFPRMFSPRAVSHETSLKGMHMKLWERTIGDPGYGFTARGPNSLVQYDDAEDPSFSMLVANTPGTFWEALPKEVIANGYLNRWLLFAAAARSAQDVVHSDVPNSITESLQDIAVGEVTGSFALPGVPRLTCWAGPMTVPRLLGRQWRVASWYAWTMRRLRPT